MWETLDSNKKAYIMQQAISEGITSLSDIKNYYAKRGRKLLRTFAEGGYTDNNGSSTRLDRYMGGDTQATQTPQSSSRLDKYMVESQEPEEDVQSNPLEGLRELPYGRYYSFAHNHKNWALYDGKPYEIIENRTDATRPKYYFMVDKNIYPVNLPVSLPPNVRSALNLSDLFADVEPEQVVEPEQTIVQNTQPTKPIQPVVEGNQFDKFVARVYQPVVDALEERGLPIALAKWITAQLANESFYDTSYLSKEANNFGGMKYFDTMGPNVKTVKNPLNNKLYVKFDTVYDYAKYHIGQLIRNWGIDKIENPEDPLEFINALHPDASHTSPLSPKHFKGDYSHGYNNYLKFPTYVSLFAAIDRYNKQKELERQAQAQAQATTMADGGLLGYRSIPWKYGLGGNFFDEGGRGLTAGNYQTVSFENGATSIPVVNSNNTEGIFNYYLQALQNAGYKGQTLYDLADQYTKSIATENVPAALPYDVVVTGNRNDYLAEKKRLEEQRLAEEAQAQAQTSYKPGQSYLDIARENTAKTIKQLQQEAYINNKNLHPETSVEEEKLQAQANPISGIDFNFLNSKDNGLGLTLENGVYSTDKSRWDKKVNTAREIGYWLPYVGDALSADDIRKDLEEGNYTSAALMAGMLAIPYGSDIRRLFNRGRNAIKRGVNSLRPSYIRSQQERARGLFEKARASSQDATRAMTKASQRASTVIDDAEREGLEELRRIRFDPTYEYSSKEELINAIINSAELYHTFISKGGARALLSCEFPKGALIQEISRESLANDLFQKIDDIFFSFGEMTPPVGTFGGNSKVSDIIKSSGLGEKYVNEILRDYGIPNDMLAKAKSFTLDELVKEVNNIGKKARERVFKSLEKDLKINTLPNGKVVLDDESQRLIQGASSLSVSPRGTIYEPFTGVTTGNTIASLKRGQNVSIQDIAPTKLGNKSATVEQITRENINELQNMFPGSVVYGSSTLTSNGVSTFLPHDYELYVTKDMIKDIEKKTGQKVSFNQSGTATVTLDHNGVTVQLDVNLVDFANSQRASSLFSYLHPREAFKINEEMAEFARGFTGSDYQLGKELEKLWKKRVRELGHSPETLLKEASAKGDIFTLVDNLASAKGKHIARLPFILNETPTKKLSEAIDLYIRTQSKGGLRSEVQFGVDAFRDVEENRRLFRAFIDGDETRQVGELGKILNEDAFVNDPERMQALYNYFMFTNSSVNRGIPHHNSYTDKGWSKADMFDWYPDTNGGTISGVGLNTVIGGSAGPFYGPIRMGMQLPVPRGSSPLETWKNINKVIANSNVPLTEEQKNTILRLAKKHGVDNKIGIDHVLNGTNSSFGDVIFATSGHSGKKYADFLQDVQSELGWAGSTNSAGALGKSAFTGRNTIYGSGIYMSGMPNLTPNGTESFFNPLYGLGYYGLDVGTHPFAKFDHLDLSDIKWGFPISDPALAKETTWGPYITLASNNLASARSNFLTGFNNPTRVTEIAYMPGVQKRQAAEQEKDVLMQAAQRYANSATINSQREIKLRDIYDRLSDWGRRIGIKPTTVKADGGNLYSPFYVNTKSTGGPLYPFSFSKNLNVKTPIVRYDYGGRLEAVQRQPYVYRGKYAQLLN